MGNQFINADSIKTMAELPDQSIDVLITDPPYPNQQGLFPESIIDGYAGLYLGAKKTKKYVVFFWSPRSPPPVPAPGWYEVSKHVWAKPDAKSITAYEHIIVWSREYRRLPSKVWQIPIVDYRSLYDFPAHPTSKPVKLMRYLLDLYTKEGDTVLDPFAGSGTTALACLQMKREYISIEKDPKYAEAAKKRLDQRALRDYEHESTTASTSTPADQPEQTTAVPLKKQPPRTR